MSQTYTINPSTDTHLDDLNATTNYETATTIITGETSGSVNKHRLLIKFAGLSDGTIPKGGTIVSATLSLYCTNDWSSTARTYRVYRMKANVVYNQCTWNKYDSSNNWQTAGGFGANDCEQTDIGTRSFTGTETLNQYKDFTLTPSAVEAIVNGSFTNNGFMVKPDTETDDAYGFTSGDAASNKPYLTILLDNGKFFQMF